ncbi:aminotransferase class V-fold PLP-dependent enzyme [Oceanidesulfovibrio marinus]|uniref:Aminotransferase class V-fold PLP-dependent enzyme n=1 Tax=Oceanidesulfovibrio marinus TaxID=370038 RepID=A0A6P1ZHF9_9BACT|nr:aminotransferase class V-fold PLP-dependent enzyme [Oceanidesulfovibrio marinus]QJT07486.1 aminotransferase class V-fold PLP-dependent enzyme [Oceanidesulfovibrio marinus]TVM34600.1 aminotransferase class V-fold PLP-dependent enzyme [Oceanidesulfovibrio marinus]
MSEYLISEELPRRFRSEFPALEEYAYLNHASVSPLPMRSAEATKRYLDDRMRYGSLHFEDWLAARNDARTRAAQLINADPEEIAFTGNTSHGLSIVAQALEWKPGDTVAVSYPDFPTVVFPWQNLARRGVKVAKIMRHGGSLRTEDVERVLDQTEARLLMVASVDFATGAACDLDALGALCRERGTLFCVDAIQSLGAAPMDVHRSSIDFLAAGGHKWLLGPIGFGILYVRQSREELLHPSTVGWCSVEDGETITLDFKLRKDAGRFEPGTQDIASLYGFAASLSLLQEAGVENIHAHTLGLGQYIRDCCAERGLALASPDGPGERSAIVSIEHPDADRAVKALSAEKVVVTLRDGRIRVAPHLASTTGDIDRLFQVLDAV